MRFFSSAMSVPKELTCVFQGERSRIQISLTSGDPGPASNISVGAGVIA